MKYKNIQIFISLIFLSILLSSFVFATTASIGGRSGSSRAVLDAKVGEIIERVLPVNNVNDIPVRIEMAPTGDLENFTVMAENNFTLRPGESRDVQLRIGVAKEGTTRTDVFVAFIPEGKLAVGALATIIIRANETIQGYSEKSLLRDLKVEESKLEKSKSDQYPEDAQGKISINNSPIFILGVSTIVLTLILISILYFYSKTGKPLKSNKPKKRATKNA